MKKKIEFNLGTTASLIVFSLAVLGLIELIEILFFKTY